MVVTKRLRPHRVGDSTDSNSNCFEIRHKAKTIPSSSPLTSKHDDDEVSGTKAMLRRRKRLKTATMVSSSSKMNWTKNDELFILAGIVDYENEKGFSYREDSDALYKCIKGSIESKFSKKQLVDKVRKLKKRFINNQARSKDGKGLDFTTTDEEEVFKLSMIIWATKNETDNDNLDQNAEEVPVLNKDVPSAEEHEQVSNMVDQENVATKNDTECATNENLDQEKDNVPYEKHEQVNEIMDEATEDAPCLEHERFNENMDHAKDVSYSEHERVSENMDQPKVDVSYAEQELVNEDMDQPKDVPCVEHERVNENMDKAKDVSYAEDERVNENLDQAKDVSCVEHERVSNISMEIDDGEKEKEKSEEDGVDEFCVLQNAFEATLFPSLGKNLQKLLLRILGNLRLRKEKS